jgi:hypothetical protein
LILLIRLTSVVVHSQQKQEIVPSLDHWVMPTDLLDGAVQNPGADHGCIHANNVTFQCSERNATHELMLHLAPCGDGLP